MNHKSVKPVVLCITALVALFVLFSVSAGAIASASRGAIAETGTPCCERHAPSQAAFSTSYSRLLAGQPCCERHAPSQVAFQSTRGSGGVYAATTARSSGVTPAQPT